jgi:hypothetical protein
MKNVVLLATSLLALAAVAALAQQSSQPDGEDIEVSVDQNGRISVPDEASTTATEGAVVWKMVSPGYTFADDGIVIKGHVGTDEQWRGRHGCRHKDARRFRCGKNGSIPGDGHILGEKYQYSIHVLDAAGNRHSLDPWIVNN